MADPELKPFDAKSLGECDGGAGKPACVAVDGDVYDVSASKMWKGGLHMKRHKAGQDLTEALAAAPHGREVLERVKRVGRLKGEAKEEAELPPWLSRLLEEVPFLRRHPHPMVVHFPIVFMYAATAFDLLYLATDVQSLEVTAFHCLAGGILFMPAAMATGYFTWWLNYLKRPMKAVRIKVILSWVLLALSAAAFFMRLQCPDVMTSAGTARILYIVILLSLTPIVSIIGYYGGELTFPTGKAKG